MIHYYCTVSSKARSVNKIKNQGTTRSYYQKALKLVESNKKQFPLKTLTLSTLLRNAPNLLAHQPHHNTNHANASDSGSLQELEGIFQKVQRFPRETSSTSAVGITSLDRMSDIEFIKSNLIIHYSLKNYLKVIFHFRELINLSKEIQEATSYHLDRSSYDENIIHIEPLLFPLVIRAFRNLIHEIGQSNSSSSGGIGSNSMSNSLQTMLYDPKLLCDWILKIYVTNSNHTDFFSTVSASSVAPNSSTAPSLQNKAFHENKSMIALSLKVFRSPSTS